MPPLPEVLAAQAGDLIDRVARVCATIAALERRASAVIRRQGRLAVVARVAGPFFKMLFLIISINPV
jgi:hypothetical protein